MDQTHPDKAAIAAPAQPGPQPSEPRRSGLWRAVAGMAAALAIAAAIVAVDLSHELVQRLSTYRSRIANLNKKVDKLKQKAVEDEKRLADARAEIKQRKLMESRDRMKAILLARDRRLMKLTAPNPREPVAATVTISEKMNGAVLSATGLAPPPEGQVYDAWWMLKDAPPAKAAEFRSGIDANATEYLDPPPQGLAPLSLAITLEPSEGGIAPSGPVKLQGKMPPAIAEVRSGSARKH
jgi:TolA-binding protein